MIRRLDRALWRLPRVVRRVVVAPVVLPAAVAAAWSAAIPAYRSAWHAGMEHVEDRPSDTFAPKSDHQHTPDEPGKRGGS